MGIIERHLGSIPHFEAQQRMLEFFNSLKQSFRLFGYPEVTLRLSPKRYRIVDVAVFLGGRPSGKKYPASPPLFVVEIVSEDELSNAGFTQALFRNINTESDYRSVL